MERLSKNAVPWKVNKGKNAMLLKMKNFVCYADQSLSAAPGTPILLIGPNGGGKSTVIDAMTWALTGTCRGFEKAKDASSLKSDPSKPVSVTVEVTGPWKSWPRGIQRASKLTLIPDTAAEIFKADRVDAIRRILNTWPLVSSPDKDRANLINAVARAGASDEVIFAEIKKKCECPEPGPTVKFNALPWGDFGDVAGALKQATDIRRSYHAAKTAKVPEDWPARVTAIEAELPTIVQVAKPDEPANVMNPEEQARLRSRILIDAKVLNGVESHLDTLVEMFGRKSWSEQKKFLEEYLAEIKGQSESMDKELESAELRAEDHGKILGEYQAKLADWNKVEGRRERLTKELARLKTSIEEVLANATDGASRYTNWDKVVDALAPDGPVAAAVLAQSSTGIDHERLRWAGQILGIDVVMGNDGSIRVGSRVPNLSSRGQNLLAGMALQEALCLAADIPFLLIDDMDALDAEAFPRAAQFLKEVAPDYEAVIAAKCTDQPQNWPGVQYRCARGMVFPVGA